MAVKTAEQAMKAIDRAANKACPKVRVLRRAAIGTAIHQGDVYMTRVADAHPHGEKRWAGGSQVAIGTQQGSRHVVEGKGVEVWDGVQYPDGFVEPEWVEPGAMRGPLVVAPHGLTLTHPEHAHHKLPAGCWQVTYQADGTTRKRVQD